MSHFVLLKQAPRVALRISTAVKTCREILQGILRYASESGQWAIQIIEEREPGDATALGLERDGYSGFIGNIFDVRNRRRLARGNMPCILIDTPPGTSVIQCDNAPIGHAAADHFLRRGFSRFAFIGDCKNSDWSTARWRAFADHLRAHGFSCGSYRRRLADDGDDVRGALADWLHALAKPVAVFVANDARALQVVNACHAASIAVPQEVAILSCDNDELICECTVPPLSSIQMTTIEAGYAAARLLDRLMREKNRPRTAIQTITYGFKDIHIRSSSEPLAIPDPLVARALTFIRLNAHTRFTMQQLAESLNVSRRLLEQRFRRVTGRTLHDELIRIRVEHAQTLLRTTEKTIADVAEICGFSSASHLGAVFKAHGEPSPLKFRTVRVETSRTARAPGQ